MTGGGADGEGTPWRVFAREGEQRLAEAGIQSPEVSVRRIIERAAGFEGTEYALGLSEAATERGVGFYDLMLERRLAGEPLQYVLGEWSFRTLDLMVDQRVLIPRPETELVVEFALEELDRLRLDEPTVADLGTGSGAIAFSIAAERPRTKVWATDASADALDVARNNLAGLGAPGVRVTLAEGPWFEALPDTLRGNLDLVISNPPYVAATDDLPAEVADWEPSGALIPGPTGLEAIEQIVRAAPDWLARPGALVVELGMTQGDAVLALAEAAGFTESRIAPDLWGRPRALVARIR
jgi:release factor glutamine methyltransferase